MKLLNLIANKYKEQRIMLNDTTVCHQQFTDWEILLHK